MTASTPFALTGTWTSVNRRVAEFNADILLSNRLAKPGEYVLRKKPMLNDWIFGPAILVPLFIE